MATTKKQAARGKYVIVRTYSAGAWAGAASLSELAMHGVSKPLECKFPCEIDEVSLTEAIEVIPATPEAIKSISEVPVWSARA